MQKLFIKKEKKVEKHGHKSVRDIENNGYSDARLKKENKKKKRDEKKIAPVLLQKYFQVSRERYVSSSIVELG